MLHEYCLLTGATGLVGQYLMRDLLLAGQPLVVIARGKRKWSAEQRIEEILQQWEQRLGTIIPRPKVLEGDIALPDLGITADDKQWLKRHCGKMIHNAALLKFKSLGGDRATTEPWRTNLGGAQNALRLTEECDIREMHYLSTAYVCGNRDDYVMESDFDKQQGFRNDYEDSKWHAEKAVRDATHFDSTTIYRPVVISGDSNTGYTSTYHGLYVYLRLFAMLIPQQDRDDDGVIQTRVKVPMKGDSTLNIVPVDWVSDVFCEIFKRPECHGKTYHLAPEKCLTPSQFIDACYDYFDSDGVEFCDKDDVSPSDNPEFANTILEQVAVYQDYESLDPRFDRSNLEAVAGHLPCPEIDADMIHRYLDFGYQDGWGKKKADKPALQATD